MPLVRTAGRVSDTFGLDPLEVLDPFGTYRGRLSPRETLQIRTAAHNVVMADRRRAQEDRDA